MNNLRPGYDVEVFDAADRMQQYLAKEDDYLSMMKRAGVRNSAGKSRQDVAEAMSLLLIAEADTLSDVNRDRIGSLILTIPEDERTPAMWEALEKGNIWAMQLRALERHQQEAAIMQTVQFDASAVLAAENRAGDPQEVERIAA